MGVDFTAHVIYGFKTTRKELAPLALDLGLIDSTELEEYGLEGIEELFSVSGCCAVELGDFFNDGEVVIYSEGVDLNIGEFKELPSETPAENRILLGLAERLGKELTWYAYAAMSY